ncbi:MAG: hypothetical protein Q9165_005926 [Trypethelium subeluteriae]
MVRKRKIGKKVTRSQGEESPPTDGETQAQGQEQDEMLRPDLLPHSFSELRKLWTYDPKTYEYHSRGRPKYVGGAPADESAAFLAQDHRWLALGCLLGKGERHLLVQCRLRDGITNDVGENLRHSPFCIFRHFERTIVYHLLSLQRSGWIRIFRFHPSHDSQDIDMLKISILPFDVGGRHVVRKDPNLQSALAEVVRRLSVSSALWNWTPSAPWSWTPSDPGTSKDNFEMAATEAPGSLFYLFNTIPSPNPRPEVIRDRYAKTAMEELLDNKVEGLIANLYPYQRRSAAEMVQREIAPQLHRDARLERRIAPDGVAYYYDPKRLQFFRDEKYYQTCSGGILAETMGLGKTLICIAVILSTFGHLPWIPPHYRTNAEDNVQGTRSLLEMAAAAAAKNSLPWRQFAGLDLDSSHFPTPCVQAIEKFETYTIPGEPVRFSRKTIFSEAQTLQLCPATIVVVPRNLFDQWQSELQKHTREGFMEHVLFMGETKKPLPPAKELKKYVIILFSRERFEHENRDGYDENGNRKGRRPVNCLCPIAPGTTRIDCSCRDGLGVYESPLKELHFLRLIIDEGNNFGSVRSNAAVVAEQLIRADRRWIVSGTPARDMLGVEVDLQRTDVDYAESHDYVSRVDALNRRNVYDQRYGSIQAVSSLGKMVSHFLKIPPWARSNEDFAEWNDYVYRHDDVKRRTYTSFSQCFQKTLNALVIKTQPEDVERDLQLPPLGHRTIRLEPSYFDRLTVNLFHLVLTSNAVTSERTDMDYLFHSSSRKDRMRLVANLRQSFFFWTGFSQSDIQAALKQSSGYLAKGDTNCTTIDRVALDTAMIFAQTALSSASWAALSKSHEIGLFVENFPPDSAEHWSFGATQTPLLVGATQLALAQEHVNRNIDQGMADPLQNLSGQGIIALAPLRSESIPLEEGSKKPILAKTGMPASSINGEPAVTRRSSASPRKKQAAISSKLESSTSPTERPLGQTGDSPTKETEIQFASAGKKRKASESTSEAPAKASEVIQDPTITQARIIGTTSAKLSYLLNEIFKYHHDEKMIIFYEGDNIAYYIAQVLDIFHIEYLIYANSIPAYLRSQWIVRFNEHDSIRILLMDLRQGARGLHASVASRVYFVNPICRPEVEAQALKRAHRIGQTRPVEVQTLILKDTIEEAMFDRSQKMTNREHTDAKNLDDDQGIQAIIQQSKPIRTDMNDERGGMYGQIAYIEEPQQLFDRAGRPRNAKGPWKFEGRREIKPGRTPRPGKDERLAKRQKMQATEQVPSSDPTIVVG